MEPGSSKRGEVQGAGQGGGTPGRETVAGQGAGRAASLRPEDWASFAKTLADTVRSG